MTKFNIMQKINKNILVFNFKMHIWVLMCKFDDFLKLQVLCLTYNNIYIVLLGPVTKKIP